VFELLRLGALWQARGCVARAHARQREHAARAARPPLAPIRIG